MKYYDVFNGDADGICALHQLRLAEPRESELVSGVKRDIRLLGRLAGIREATITVLDISLETNREDLAGLLAASNRVLYIDHHFAGVIPQVANLEAHIDPRPEMCTSLIVDRLLAGRYRAWAVAAAFGDNLHGAAREKAATLNLDEDQLARLLELGELLNYNGYGRTMADLHFDPTELYRAVQPFADPFDFCGHSPILSRLRAGYEGDMLKARTSTPIREHEGGRIYRFPAKPWARRSAGVFINEKARARPEAAHALLVANGDDTFTVSVRAPLDRREGADTLCRHFPNGGGRAAAAGINDLPADRIDEFLRLFEEAFE
ncbi:MAG: acetyltransferase [Deltaproteobacteria bacterium]|jgi:hypothetical protein